MGNAAVDVSVRLGLHDSATPGIDKFAARVKQAAEKTTQEVERGNARQRTSYERTSQAREVLGVRSEQRIQREIAQTEAAYNRLMRAGKLSAQEQARAMDATRQKVTQLTNEMGKLTAAQEKSARAAELQARGVKALQVGGAVMAGGAAAAYTLRDPVRSALGFDERVGLLSNTAYAEFGPTGRRAGDAEIKAAIANAVKTGITKDAAMSALEKLVADNQVGGVQGALQILPYIGKVSTGSGSAADQVATMMGSFIGSGYAKDVAGAQRLMGISSAGAVAGAFEKSDMAKHLPALLPAAKAAGLTGEAGFKQLIVLLQQARTTAGSSDQAAMNVANLLPKLASSDTAKDFEKAGRGDLAKYLMMQRAQGVDPLTAWQNVIDSEIEKNPNLKPAMARLKAAKTSEDQAAAIESIKGMAEGQSIGRYFQDMQARGALFGLRNKDVADKVNASFGMAGSVVDGDYAHMRNRSGVEMRVAGELNDLGKSKALDSLTPAIGSMASGFSTLSERFPVLTGSATLAATALGAAAAAAGVFTLTAGGGGGRVGKAITNAAGRAVPYLPSGKTVGRAGLLGVGALVGGAGLDAAAGEGSAVARYGSSMLNGAATGAMVGSLVPVVGTVVGGAVGGALGGLVEWLRTDAKKEPPKMQGEIKVSVSDDRVRVTQTSMNATGMVANMSAGTGNIMTGAPG
ncbi:phage tail tape measure protein [Rhodoferax sp. BLA1]|uniref:phage tail tape measure protein n=1 Tax=Rhodoferax sp. BLA1 TaxID=2576062 RepID=UPI0015D3711C|nr:phage tail tape measure protein [Rhodoferax sp. BLA1]